MCMTVLLKDRKTRKFKNNGCLPKCKKNVVKSHFKNR